MYDKELEIVNEDLQSLTAEEIADLKVELEDLLIECDEILNINNEENE